MPDLHFGFVDVPYPGQIAKRNSRGRFLRRADRSVDVAEALEKRYHIVETFSDQMLDYISEELSYYYDEQLEELFESRTRSGPGKFARNITLAFRDFIRKGGMDDAVRGVPTKASIEGKTWRPGYGKFPTGETRPSFIDTGTYIGSFRAWVD